MGKAETNYAFKEKFVEVGNGELIIKCYYFPICTDKVVLVKDVRRLRYVKQSNSFVKNWGSSGSPVWWACDMKRNFRQRSDEFYNVMIDNGEWLEKGFTVHDIVGFQRALRNDLQKCSIEALQTY